MDIASHVSNRLSLRIGRANGREDSAKCTVVVFDKALYDGVLDIDLDVFGTNGAPLRIVSINPVGAGHIAIVAEAL